MCVVTANWLKSVADMEIHRNTDLSSNPDVTETANKSASVNECRDQCIPKASCVAFSWNYVSGQCLLIMNVVIWSEPSLNVTSGVLNKESAVVNKVCASSSVQVRVGRQILRLTHVLLTGYASMGRHIRNERKPRPTPLLVDNLSFSIIVSQYRSITFIKFQKSPLCLHLPWENLYKGRTIHLTGKIVTKERSAILLRAFPNVIVIVIDIVTAS